MRERIGNSRIQRIEEIPLHKLEEAIDKLLELLFKNGISSDPSAKHETSPASS